MPRTPSKKSKNKSHPPKPTSLPATPSRYFASCSNEQQVIESNDETWDSEYGDDPPYNSYWSAVVHAVRAKPLLIQGNIYCLHYYSPVIPTALLFDDPEKIAHDPWKVLVATMLLNVTTGKKAIPIFWILMDKWPNPTCMANGLLLFTKQPAPADLEPPASQPALAGVLQPLGLFNKRAERLLIFSKQYIENPPSFDRLWKSRVTGNYPPTAVSHYVGCGRYALDSFRIFCCADDEWKSVMPLDKELIKYLKWKWAVEAYRKWDPVRGVIGPIDEEHLWSLAPFSQY